MGNNKLPEWVIELILGKKDDFFEYARNKQYWHTETNGQAYRTWSETLSDKEIEKAWDAASDAVDRLFEKSGGYSNVALSWEYRADPMGLLMEISKNIDLNDKDNVRDLMIVAAFTANNYSTDDLKKVLEAIQNRDDGSNLQLTLGSKLAYLTVSEYPETLPVLRDEMLKTIAKKGEESSFDDVIQVAMQIGPVNKFIELDKYIRDSGSHAETMFGVFYPNRLDAALEYGKEKDAFKHTFISAMLSLQYGHKNAEFIMDCHEAAIWGRVEGEPQTTAYYQSLGMMCVNGEESVSLPKTKANNIMDLYNNNIGFEIAEEIREALKSDPNLRDQLDKEARERPEWERFPTEFGTLIPSGYVAKLVAQKLDSNQLIVAESPELINYFEETGVSCDYYSLVAGQTSSGEAFAFGSLDIVQIADLPIEFKTPKNLGQAR